MECEEVKKEFSQVKDTPCCPSCHEDDENGFGNDLWFTDFNGEDRNVCCALSRAMEPK